MPGATTGSSLLALIQEVCKRSNIPPPSAVAASTDPMYLQMMALLNEELEEVSSRYRFQGFTYPVAWTTIAAENQGNINTISFTASGAPGDGRVLGIIRDSMWNTSTSLPVFGPISPQEWEMYKALPMTGTLFRFRLINDNLHIYPQPEAGQALRFEVISNMMIVDSLGTTYKLRYTADGDKSLLQDALLIAGLRWRWKREKGLSYAEDKARYESVLAGITTLDGGGGRTISMDDDFSKRVGPGLIIPPGSWNLP